MQAQVADAVSTVSRSNVSRLSLRILSTCSATHVQKSKAKEETMTRNCQQDLVSVSGAVAMQHLTHKHMPADILAVCKKCLRANGGMSGKLQWVKRGLLVLY